MEEPRSNQEVSKPPPIQEKEATAAIEDGYKALVKATQISNTFPVGESYELYKTYSDFNAVTLKLRENISSISNVLLNKELPLVKFKMSDNDTNKENLLIANDSYLDKINLNIDNFLANSDSAQPEASPSNSARPASWNRAPVMATIQVNGMEASLFSAANIRRPQLSFTDVVDNSEAWFVPRISIKPNGITPLNLTIKRNLAGEPIGYNNPYEEEIESFEPPSWSMVPLECKRPAPPQNTSLTMVNTPKELNSLLAHLNAVTEIAVDLEHHTYRSYQGITCLMQITTITGGDFILDTLALRDHLHRLNTVFTDPKIVKVFHGADNDVLWLQRDFGIYVVGMIDTHQISQLLCLQRRSLKDLLQRYCDLTVDKSYQTADWRIRPLPIQLIDYARQDTHYLLYIWHCMQNQLLEKGGPKLLLNAFQRSAHIAKSSYHKKPYSDDDCIQHYKKNAKRYNSSQMTAFKSLWKWRDQQARALDESPGYILPANSLCALAEHLPREIQGIRALMERMTPVVATQLDVVHQIILACRAIPKDATVNDIPPNILDLLVLEPLHNWTDSSYEAPSWNMPAPYVPNPWNSPPRSPTDFNSAVPPPDFSKPPPFKKNEAKLKKEEKEGEMNPTFRQPVTEQTYEAVDTTPAPTPVPQQPSDVPQESAPRERTAGSSTQSRNQARPSTSRPFDYTNAQYKDFRRNK